VKFMICGNSEIIRLKNLWRDMRNPALTPIPSFIIYSSPSFFLYFTGFPRFMVLTEYHIEYHESKFPSRLFVLQTNLSVGTILSRFSCLSKWISSQKFVEISLESIFKG